MPDVDVPDERTMASTPVKIPIIEIVGQAALERAWLLTELDGQRPQFEMFEHEDLCNLNPSYRKTNPAAPKHCDRRCVEHWRVTHLRIE